MQAMDFIADAFRGRLDGKSYFAIAYLVTVISTGVFACLAYW